VRVWLVRRNRNAKVSRTRAGVYAEGGIGAWRVTDTHSWHAPSPTHNSSPKYLTAFTMIAGSMSNMRIMLNIHYALTQPILLLDTRRTRHCHPELLCLRRWHVWCLLQQRCLMRSDHSNLPVLYLDTPAPAAAPLLCWLCWVCQTQAQQRPRAESQGCVHMYSNRCSGIPPKNDFKETELHGILP
jgi:hypothetical protein